MSAAPIAHQQLSYFGKLPSRGDFVKGHYNPQLLKALDQWVSQAMELLAEDPRWKAIYDNLPAMHFACVGSRTRLSVVGHLRPGTDSSSRRFPFLAAVPLEAEGALDFMVGAPMLLGPWWRRTAEAIATLATATELDDDLKRLESDSPRIDTAFGASSLRASYADFTRRHSLLRLEQMLAFDGHAVSVRRLILALGLLLQPVMGSGVNHLAKGLALPLPRDPVSQDRVATFWLELMAGFFARSDFELVLIVTPIDGRMRLVIGFDGLSPQGLHGVMHPQAYAERNIEIDNPEWVEDSVHSNHAMHKLVSYLDQPQLPLAIVLRAFRDVFIGE